MFYGEDVDEEWFHYRITADNTKPKRQPAFPSARFYSNGTAAGAFGTLCTIEEALIIMETANTLSIVLFGFSGAVALLIGYQIRQGQASEAISLPNLSLEKM